MAFTSNRVKENSNHWDRIVNELAHDMKSVKKAAQIDLQSITLKAVAVFNVIYSKVPMDKLREEEGELIISPNSDSYNIIFTNGKNTIEFSTTNSTWYEFIENERWFRDTYRMISEGGGCVSNAHDMQVDIRTNADVPATDDNPFGIDI
tara:strand:- start:141 stop:587 length:447 start_codon:yes stop_codon:yes gene_type:complete